MGQGRDNAKTYLKENPKVQDEIVAKVKEQSVELMTGGKMAKKSASEKAVEKAAAKRRQDAPTSEQPEEELRLDVTPDETDFL